MPAKNDSPLFTDADAPRGPKANRGVPTGALYPTEPGGPTAEPTADNRPLPIPEPPQPATNPPAPKTWRDKLRSNLSTVAILLLAPIIAWSISAFALQSYQVDGISMENTLQNHDRLIIDKVGRSWARLWGGNYIPGRGSIIIFNLTSLACGETGTKQLIKRVIGLPGERVVVKGDDVTVYNKDNPNGFQPDKAGKYQVVTGADPQPSDVTLKSDELFVAGDNRPNSCDSRYFGPVNAKDIIGKLVLRILPFNKISSY